MGTKNNMINGEYRDLEGRLDTLLESTESIRTEIKKENAKHDLRIRSNRRATRAAIAVGLIGIVVGAFGFIIAHNASHTAAQTNSALEISRVASCDQYNKVQISQAVAEKTEIRVLVNAVISSQKQTPELLQRIGDFYGVYDAQVDRDHQSRDCSPEGIAAYLNLPG